MSFAAPSASANHFDNMFKTNNLNRDCQDSDAFSPRLCRTDNRTVGWHDQNSLPDDVRPDIREVLEASFEATVLTVGRDETPQYTGLGETDIIYQQGPLVPGAAGVTWCDDAISDVLCDQQYVLFDSNHPPKKLICHESGHTIGLTHGQDAAPSVSNANNDLGCLQAPFSEITNDLLGSHNKVQINNVY